MTIVTKLPPSLGPGFKAGRGAAQNFSRAPPIAKHLVQLMKLKQLQYKIVSKTWV